MEDKVREAILQEVETKDDKRYLTCAQAFQIAEALGVKPALIGKILNKERIKLKSCQLGCF